ncbi:MAG: hypothetical protein ACR2GR_00330 [Rhodothermales bacterium]
MIFRLSAGRTFRFTPFAALHVLLLCSTAALGCRSASQTASDAVSPDSASAPRSALPDSTLNVPPDFEMRFGEGGGFTGAWSGYTIRADGTVLAWKGLAAEQSQDSVGVLARQDLANLWQEVQALGFFEQTMDEPGNMTASIRIRADGQEHTVRWVPGLASMEPPKTPVEAFYRESWTLAEKAAN